MDSETARTNTLIIALLGFAILVAGLLLIVFREDVARHIRFFLPLPPIAVAAYVLALNVFRQYDNGKTLTAAAATSELLSGTLIAAAIFCALSSVILVGVTVLRRMQ